MTVARTPLGWRSPATASGMSRAVVNSLLTRVAVSVTGGSFVQG